MASKRNIRRRACRNKVAHDSQEAAVRAIRNMRYDTRPDAGELVPYHCRDCGRFHVGHAPADVRRAIAARRAG